jgi:N-acetylneuraminate lyase
MAEVAGGAPNLPFYYYHIPTLTGSKFDMVEFLNQGGERISNLVGLKYTEATLHEFQECLELQDGRFDVVWGLDEMLLAALATGATAGIGSTYNIAAPLYLQLIEAFHDNNLQESRRLQSLSISMIRILTEFPFHPAMKAVLAMKGIDVGGCRFPLGRLAKVTWSLCERI